MTEPVPPELPAPAHIARGVVQTLGSTYFGRLVNWVAVVLLTRELPPEQFGHVALAASLLAIVVALRNLGLHLALLRQYDRVDELAPTHFVLNTVLGAAGSLVAIGLAFLLVGDKYGQEVATALVVFAGFDLLRAAAQTVETQLRKDLEFGFLARSHAISLAIAAVVGIYLAYDGAGIWALIVSHSVFGIGYVAAYCLLVWRRRSPFELHLAQFDPEGARELMTYGLWIWGGALLQTLLLNCDRILVADLLSASALGFYERAHVFAQLPTGAITGVVSGILVTVFARYQDQREKLSEAFRLVLRYITRAALPLSLLIAIEIPRIVQLLLGDAWLPMVPVLRALVLFSISRPVIEAIMALLRAIGDARGIVAFSAVQAVVLLLTAPWLTSHYGIEGTALSMNIVAGVGFFLALRRSHAVVDFSSWSALLPPALAAAAGTAAHYLVGPQLSSLAPGYALFFGGALFLVCYGGILLLLERELLRTEAGTLWRLLRNRPDS